MNLMDAILAARKHFAEYAVEGQRPLQFNVQRYVTDTGGYTWKAEFLEEPGSWDTCTTFASGGEAERYYTSTDLSALRDEIEALWNPDWDQKA